MYFNGTSLRKHHGLVNSCDWHTVQFLLLYDSRQVHTWLSGTATALVNEVAQH